MIPYADVDILAPLLGHLAALARRMPPAWDGMRLAIPCHAPNAPRPFGHVLPGRGLLVGGDLWSIGIRRQIPGVLERSQVARLADAFAVANQRDGLPPARDPWYEALPVVGGRKLLCPERRAVDLALRAPLTVTAAAAKRLAAVVTLDSILDARANGKAFDRVITKASITTVANAWSTLYRAGGLPPAGTYTNIPGGAVHARDSTGAWSFGLSDPGGSDLQLLLGWGFNSSSAINFLWLVDLLVACGNILATTAAAQTVNSTALTRYTGGEGVMAIMDITTQMSATAHNIQLNKYTDQSGNTLNDTGAQAGLNAGIVMRLDPAVNGGPFFTLAGNDYGVRSVEEFTCSAALAAGVYALNLYFPLMIVPGVAANIWAGLDAIALVDRMVRIQEDGGGKLGCVTGYAFTNTTTSGALPGQLNTCQVAP